ncbi:MAG: permease-like cell division protein FtsX [Clostridiales bacterium]|nr:permease-like cell division protein FtsX [Clostridiales bacterium]
MVSRSIKYLVNEGIRSIWTNRLMSLASVAVLMSCLILIGSAFLVFVNINSLMGKIEEQNVVMAYLEDDATETDIETAETQLLNMTNVKDVTFVPKEEAWEEQLAAMKESEREFFKEYTDDDSIPLPDAYKVTVSNMDEFDETVDSISRLEKIERVRENKDLAQQLVSIRQGFSIVAIAVIAILFAVSMFIISNTIRLTMYSRRLEITIMKSVGATDNFVKIPFIVEGIVLGILSGVVSLLLVWGVYEFAIVQFEDLLSSFGMDAVPFGDTALLMTGVFVLIGVASGTIGSLISMRRYLRKEGSEISVS